MLFSFSLRVLRVACVSLRTSLSALNYAVLQAKMKIVLCRNYGSFQGQGCMIYKRYLPSVYEVIIKSMKKVFSQVDQSNK